jgi:hypothetical protein
MDELAERALRKAAEAVGPGDLACAVVGLALLVAGFALKS